MSELTTIPTVELGKILAKLRAAYDLKYKIMNIMYPRYPIRYGENTAHFDMQDMHRENERKLNEINELVRSYEP